MKAKRIAIVGAGLGGLAAAIALRQRGFEVEVFERAAELKEFGAGINVSPNGIKAMRALGLGDELDSVAYEPDRIVARDSKTAAVLYTRPIKQTTTTRYGTPYYLVHRGDLLNLLRAALPDALIHLNSSCVGVEQAGESVGLRFADGSQTEADLVIGADGIRSTIRSQIIGDIAPKFSGIMCFRALVPTAALPAGYLDPDATFWVARNGHTVIYYVSHGRNINIVAGFHVDSWTEESWSVESSVEELLEAMSEFTPHVRRIVEHAPLVRKWGVFDLAPLPRWTAGRVTLLGDAAHAMIPMHGQGANMAMEDGVVLAAWCDELRNDLPAALAAYEASRKPRTTRQQHFARSETKVIEDLALPSNQATQHRTPPDVDWLYAYDPATQWRGSGPAT